VSLLRNLFFLFTITVFALASTILSIYNYDPTKSDVTVFANFYISLFFTLLGVITIALYYIKSKFKANNQALYFWPSVRSATFLSAGLTSLLFLQGLRILDWLIGISVTIVVILLELFFRTKPKKVEGK
jgi:hypothetical protein